MEPDFSDDFTGDARDAAWLLVFFEFEYCMECGGDADVHLVVPGPFGKRFALCKETVVP